MVVFSELRLHFFAFLEGEGGKKGDLNYRRIMLLLRFPAVELYKENL